MHFDYSSTHGGNLNRLDALKDDDGSGGVGNAMDQYTYLGMGQVVKVDCPEPDLLYDLDHGTAGNYDGLGGVHRLTDLDPGNVNANRDGLESGTLSSPSAKSEGAAWCES